MKLVSLNIDVFNTNNTPLKKLLKEIDPDFVCIQEATRRLENSVDPELESIKAITDATPGLKHFMFGPNKMIKRIKFSNFHGHDHFLFEYGGFVEWGQYTSSRYPIIFGENVFVQNNYALTTDSSNWPEEDQRSVLYVDIDIDGKKLRVINYHGVWTRDKRGNDKTKTANQIILDIVKQAPGKVILCGDFNLFPDTEEMQLFESSLESLIDTYKIQSTRPVSNELNGNGRNVVDYVWVSKGIKIQSFEVKESNVSDHLPLILEFSF